jgi:hypothetical protein
MASVIATLRCLPPVQPIGHLHEAFAFDEEAVGDRLQHGHVLPSRNVAAPGWLIT